MNNEQHLKQVREAIHFTEQSKKDFDAYHDGAPVKEFDTILLALRFMEKMLGEPSVKTAKRCRRMAIEDGCEHIVCEEAVKNVLSRHAKVILKELEE